MWRRKLAFSSWIVVAIVIVTRIGQSDSRNVRRIRNNKHHMTKIACEGEMLNITCPADHVINIIRANYGRFSLLECNERSEAWPDVQCMYPKSTRVMEERCGRRAECAVNASNDVFQDACPNVGKYLEVQYACVDKWLDVNATTVVHTSPTETPRVITESPVTSQRPSATAAPTLLTTIRQVTEKPSYCPETERRGLQWPATRVGNPARLGCPNNGEAYAEWWCSTNGDWMGNPDLSRCVSTWARQLDAQSKVIDNEESAKLLARNLQSSTRTHGLYGGDTNTAVAVMQRLADTADTFTEGKPSGSGMAFVKDLNNYVVETGSNLLQEERRVAWSDLPQPNQTDTADRLITAVEDMAVAVAKELDGPATTLHFVSPKITVEVSKLQVQDYVQFPTRSLYDNRLDNIQLPRVALEKSGHDFEDWTKVIVVSYHQLLGEYMKPDSTIVVDENGVEMVVERRVASRLLSANIVKMNRANAGSQLGQRDIAAVGQLSQPVHANFALKNVDENMSNPMCVYWRQSDNKWATNGCSIKKRNESHVTCSCNHLTTFAVLMDVRGLRLGPLHHFTLSFITCVGCAVSIFSCAVAIVAFCCFSGTHFTDRITVHKNLCFCLLVAESVFLFGIAQTQHRLACSVVAGLLHYFFLAAFAWMLLEGFQLYSLLIEVFEGERSRRPFFYLFGYGMPAVIVGISLLVDHNSYGTQRHCWLNTDNYFVFSFVGPVAAVLAANVVFLIMALVVMCRHAAFSAAHRHDAEKSTIENVAVWLKGSTILVILLGLTWAFGLLYISESTLAMAYLFTGLNSLQGFFIFVFHVVLNEKTKKEWNKWLLRHRGRTSSWIRAPPAAADYKPAKARMDEPMPMLIGVIRTTETDHLPMSSGEESPSLLSKLFGRQRQRNSVRGSVGQLLLVRSGSVNSRKTCECPYATYSCSSDVATNSDLAVEPPCTRYCANPRPPPPNFRPPSLPKHSPVYYTRRHLPPGAVSVFPVIDDQQFMATGLTNSMDRSLIDRFGDRAIADRMQLDDHANPYASTDAYFPADSDRPDSGYSGSAHHPTPPPAASYEKEAWAQMSPVANARRHQKKRCHEVTGRNLDLSYEVPVHAATASASPYDH